MTVKLTKTEDLAIRVMGDALDCGLYTRQFMEEAGLSRVQARRALRGLVRKKLAEVSPLWRDCDGMLAGSGYCLTAEGDALAKKLEKEATEKEIQKN